MTIQIQLHPLPYIADSASLFGEVRNKPWSMFLDSGYPLSQQGRYDIIVTDPVCTLVTRGDVTVICRDGQKTESTADPFMLLKAELGESIEPVNHLPFCGGALGYFSYDLSRRLETLPVLANDQEHIPEMAVGIYDWAVIVDHHDQCSWLVGQGLSAQEWQILIDRYSQPIIQSAEPDFEVLASPVSNMDHESYALAFNKIKSYLQEGDSYQVNLAQRFSSPCQGDPWAAYLGLRQINSAPFSAYLNIPGVQVLSSSPERFLQVINGVVETKPIKGTRPRKLLHSQDQQQISALASSLKDRAENLMIVDLLRNDISKNCRKGSVKVPKLFEVESYATVHHLVSTVSGVLDENQHAIDLLRNCFPGGSITGAPKIRSMEIIEELEPNRRGIYCGAIGYIGFDGNMDTNIAIRTLVHSDHTIRFWAGGGIVNDSVLEEEYQESFDKAAALLQVLVSFKTQ
jgi:para-aminobenzoate synthetase component I